MNSNPFEEALFKEATWRALGIEAEKMMAEPMTRDYQPSNELKAKVMQMYRKKKKRRISFSFISSKLAAGFIIGFLLTAVLFSAVPSFALWTMGLLRTEKEGFTQYQIDSSVRHMTKQSSLVITYIPEGFVLREYTNMTGFNEFFHFENDNQEYIQINFISSDSPIQVDNEDLETKKEILINGSPAMYISKYGQSHITWIRNNLIVMVASSLSEQETIRIATGIKNK